MEKIRFSIREFSKVNKDAAIIVFSDHGHSEIKEYLTLPEIDGILLLGESRVAFYRLSVDEVEEHLSSLQNKAEIVPLKNLGLYSKKIEKKYGKTAVLPREGYGLSYPFEKPTDKVSGHGGKSKKEMTVKVWTQIP